MVSKFDPAELRRRYESWDTEEILSRVNSGGLEPESEGIARQVLSARGLDVASGSSDNYENDQASKGPSGVGGWLLLLVISLTFLGPLMGFGRLYGKLMFAEDQNPSLRMLESWGTFKSATLGTFLVVAGLSFYAGLGLARGRDMAVVKRAKILLWVIGPVASVVLGLFIPFVVFGKSQLDPQTIGGLIASAIVAAIWTAYLSMSKRVHATYVNGASKDSA
jgi:hypothetical protein